ncbi:Borealin-like protein Nbl1 [Schizosaccharomyces osmophilus]|uniref:Borealin-like protein Nbl1 n=1 Tax=Schizosaccharomyces osmophilus TaxID=2545709 RepID=A0AAF0AU23_9SCHI|nr:Borealin-like protein Nbl1 [Schizosaccharomyces osmophilus]WBW70953.1 Borealin-like protein Nbl1 [Schizosaccharomyces osmophilus]
MNKRKRVEEIGESKHRQVRQRILQERKTDILENLAFELSDKIRRLRSNAGLLASTIRMRGEMRVASIPRAQRNMKLRDFQPFLSSNTPVTPWRTRIQEFYKLEELSMSKRKPNSAKASPSKTPTPMRVMKQKASTQDS